MNLDSIIDPDIARIMILKVSVNKDLMYQGDTAQKSCFGYNHVSCVMSVNFTIIHWYILGVLEKQNFWF